MIAYVIDAILLGRPRKCASQTPLYLALKTDQDAVFFKLKVIVQSPDDGLFVLLRSMKNPAVIDKNPNMRALGIRASIE